MEWKLNNFLILSVYFVALMENAFAQSNSSSLHSEYQKRKNRAEQLFSEKSYSSAHDLYEQMDSGKLPPEEARWVLFRKADTLWRSHAGTKSSDSSKLDDAREQLERLIRDIKDQNQKDETWAEIQESLGDFWWTRRDRRNWGQAWAHYQHALDWWSGARDINKARDRYLNMVWKMATPPQAQPYYYYGYFGNYIDLNVLENILKIAQTENDRAHSNFLIAMTASNRGGYQNKQNRIAEAFEAALKPGKSTVWYDDALFNYAQWMENNGRRIESQDGTVRFKPDYSKALDLYQRLIREFRKGETKYFDNATRRIEQITQPNLNVSVSSIFLPDSEIQYHINWRNLEHVEFAIYKVDLTGDITLANNDSSVNNWIQNLTLSSEMKIKSWSFDTQDKKDYKPNNKQLRLDQKLSLGAYIIEGKSGKLEARELILVTDASIVLKTSGSQALVYFCDALVGSPLPNANVRMFEKFYDNNTWKTKDITAETDENGLAVFQLRGKDSQNVLVMASLDDKQAFASGHSYYHRNVEGTWKIYAFTDRPAYRPEEEVKWKFIARQYKDSIYATPSNQTIEYEIYDPQGSKVKEDKVTLNAFGSAWGSLKVTSAMPLGEYHLNFWTEGRKQSIGGAALFRLEEYKLPEFKVTAKTPEENGRKKAFKLGETVDVIIQADYYFDAPVAEADVEVLVYQNPFYHIWHPPRKFPWFYDDTSPYPRHYYGNGQVVKREKLKTDATGKAELSFETPRGQQEFEYRIEARVTDSSRREIMASDTVRVTRQRYYTYLTSDHYLHRPQDKVVINIKTLDANNQPVEVEGAIKVTRDYWFEIWLDPSGHEVKGEQLKQLREKSKLFPPPSERPDQRPWQLKFRGYQHDEILTQTVKTNANGEAEFSFTPEREGYYRVQWSSKDKDNMPIKAETTVWVATKASQDIGYNQGNLEIIFDKDTVHAGKTAPFMIHVPTHDRYVLFSIEGDDLYSYQLIHLTGTVKLIEIPITEQHVPNFFINATMVTDRQLFMDTKQVIVPPVENFITVDVETDREHYQPREEAVLSVKTSDHEGKSVAAEVALSVIDESVFYIQEDYAGDPRQFFYGSKRGNTIATQSTFYQKNYLKLVETEDQQLIDDRYLKRAGIQKGNMLDQEYDLNEIDAIGDYRDNVQRKGMRLERSLKAELGSAEGQAMSSFAKMEGKKIKAMRTAQAPAPSEKDQSSSVEAQAVQVRSDFRSTAFWQPDIVTDTHGEASVTIPFPDSLTTWKASARAVGGGNQFGIGTTSTRTKQPLIFRLQAPRFFVVGDEVVISAVINNNTDERMSISASLEAEGISVLGRIEEEKRVEEENKTLSIDPNGEARVDWVASVRQPGTAKLKAVVKGDVDADAMEKAYPVYEHGIEKFMAKSGKVRADDIMVKLNIPKERKIESTQLNVHVTPSMAVMMLDALPYLIDYPYGCTEQTMSRFLPTVITAKTLSDRGIQPQEIIGKIFGGIEQRHEDQTQPQGRKDLRKLNDMVERGLQRLVDFQHSDGGWGWWKDGDSDPFMSAYVVWGLSLARATDVKIKNDVLQRGVDFLDKELVEQESQVDLQAWMLHALSVFHKISKTTKASEFQAKAFDNLWQNRDSLNAYTRALLALSAKNFGYDNKAKTLVRNLENGVVIDDRPDQSILIDNQTGSNEAVMRTAHWGEDGIYWRWSDGGIEATAFALRALVAIDPGNELIEPVMNWLVKNRRGAQWDNTRDTAIVILALNEYLRSSGELKTDLEFELWVNDERIAGENISPDQVLRSPSQFQISRRFIKDGENTIRFLRKSGEGTLYFSVHAEFFSLEEPVPAAGNEIFVKRQYYKQVGRPTLLKGYVYDKERLNDGETVTSGDRVEAVITIEAKNNYEYLVFEDLKPAGLEAVQIRSGEPLYAKELKSSSVDRKFKKEDNLSGGHTDYTNRSRWVYQELRDRKVALFIDKLPQGIWEIRYDLRAEIPGTFHALPVLSHAMYVPELRANSTEIRLTIEDKKN